MEDYDAEEELHGAKLFIDRVTVAGLQEACKNKSRADRYMFRIALVLALIGITYTSYFIVRKYTLVGRVTSNFDVVGVQAPFPNVTICGPEAIKVEAIKKEVLKYASTDMQKLLNLFNGSMDEALEGMRNLFSFSVRTRPTSPTIRASVKVANSLVASMSYVDFFHEIYPTCAEMFHDCSFENSFFNCCDATELMLFDSRVCYQFSLSRVPQLANMPARIGGDVPDASNMDRSGLRISSKIFWPNVIFLDDTASDGFNVFIGELTIWASPIAIPAEMDAIIVLSPPDNIIDLTDCRSEANLPKMKHTGYYDAYGFQCMYELLEQNLLDIYGCSMPVLNYRPDNDTTCNTHQAISLNNILAGDFFNSITNRKINDPRSNISSVLEGFLSKELAIRDQGRIAFQQCLPFCNRHTYDIISASYGLMQRRDQFDWDPKEKNISQGRIRIFFPEASYRIQEEEYASSGYLAACEIGGVMGVYLGFSMVTLVQISVYGVLICIDLKKPKTIEKRKQKPTPVIN